MNEPGSRWGAAEVGKPPGIQKAENEKPWPIIRAANIEAE
jgi:hypothetical protein